VINSVRVTNIVGGRVATGQRAIERLEKAGIIKEFETGRLRNKLYVADEIHRLVTT
jgi:hypothetical protein